jgi:hypothetical protein
VQFRIKSHLSALETAVDQKVETISSFVALLRATYDDVWRREQGARKHGSDDWKAFWKDPAA